MSNFFSSNSSGNNFFSFDKEKQPQDLQTDGLFSTASAAEENNKNSLNSQYDNIKNNYEQIFIEAAESIRRELNQFKPSDDICRRCPVKDCKIEKKDVFSPYPPNCEFRDWQLKALTFLAGDYRQKLKAEYKAIMDKKK